MDSRFLFHTRAGQKRLHSPPPENEDRVLVREFPPSETGALSTASLLVVADGVSRCPRGGEVADWLVEEQLRHRPIFTVGSPLLLREQLLAFLRDLHSQFLQDFESVPEMRLSGCTLAGALIYEDRGTA
ncbi:MAG: PP2C family serine/threonine-protein phosphatase, partial [Verrucomicrobiota bacterium]